jgi:hypothetical protein
MVVAQAKDKALIGAAGVFHVSMELTLRGIIALPTIRNTAGYDIIATTQDGVHHANIQVKTSGQWVNSWPICEKIESVKDGPDDYYVVLRRNRKKDAFECFMLKGDQMKEWLAGEQKWYETKGRERKFSRCLNFDKEGKEAAKFEKQWKEWDLIPR